MLLRKWSLLLVFLLALIAYWPSFYGPFQYDDYIFIVNNEHLKNLSFNLDKSISGMSIHSRHFTLWTFALNYQISKLDPWSYHLINFIIHLGVIFLIYYLTRLLTRIPAIASVYKDKLINNLPVLVALIFAVHPLNTQAITYISQRFESLVTLCYLLSLIFYIKMRLTTTLNVGILYFILFLCSFFLCFISKETSFTLPIMILMIEWLLLRSVRNFYLIGIIILAALPCILYWKVIAGAIVARHTSLMHDYDVYGFYEYILTYFRSIARYLLMAIMPINQNIDPDIIKSTSIINPISTLFSIMSVIAMACWAFMLRFKRPLVTMGLLFFLITLSIGFFPRQIFFAEHKAYLPIVGLIIAFVEFLLVSNFFKSSLKLIVTLIILLFITLTFSRNLVWLNQMTLWQDAVLKSPNKARTIGNYVSLLDEVGMQSESLKVLNLSIDRNPNSPDLYFQRASTYMTIKNYSEALNDLNQAITLNNQNYKYYLSRGLMNRKLNNIEQSIMDFNQLLEFNLYSDYAYVNLGINYAILGHNQEAINFVEKGLALSRESNKFLEPYIAVLYVSGDYIKAIKVLEKILKIKPSDANMLAVMGNCQEFVGNKELAESYYLKSIESAVTKRGVLSLYKLYQEKESKKAEDLIKLYPQFNFNEQYDAKVINLLGL